ncbi:hypothetical protein D9M68_576200 [compost metagenome]
MVHFGNVGLRVGDELGGVGQRARQVAQVHANAGQASGAHHAALDQFAQHQRVDVAAGQYQADALALVAPAAVVLRMQQRGQARCAGAFDDRLLDFQQHHDRVLDIAFGNQFDTVDQLAHDRLRQRAGRFHGDAFGDGVLPLRHGHTIDRGVHGRKTFGLHADDLDAGLERLGRGGDPRNQAAPADGDNQRIQLRLVFQHFQRHRALPRNDGLVVIRMDHGQPALLRQLVAARLGIIEGVARQHHFGAETARIGDLHGRREARHHDHRGHPHAVRVVGHALRVVAGRHGDHARRALGIRQRQHAVQRAPLLERRRELQVLELQPDFGAENVGQRAGKGKRGLQHLAAQVFAGGLNGGDIDHDGESC